MNFSKLILIVFISIAFSQQSQEIKLSNVEIEGNIIASSNTILFTSGLREGLTIKATEFQRAIKRLWNLGLFEDIQIRYDKEDSDGLSITIIVKENPILGEIYFEGNKKIKDKKFNDEIDLIQGQRIRPNTINETLKRMKELYSDKGYLNSEISWELIDPKSQSKSKSRRSRELVKDVIFNIKENTKVKIGKIILIKMPVLP